MPKRIQRSRAKGWRMPVGAVYVGRPTWFGNPFRAGDYVDRFVATNDTTFMPRDQVSWFGRRANEIVADDAEAVEMYRRWLIDCNNRNVPLPVGSLRGKDLACWCALDAPCHADVLLAMANMPRHLVPEYQPFIDVTWAAPAGPVDDMIPWNSRTGDVI